MREWRHVAETRSTASCKGGGKLDHVLFFSGNNGLKAVRGFQGQQRRVRVGTKNPGKYLRIFVYLFSRPGLVGVLENPGNLERL